DCLHDHYDPNNLDIYNSCIQFCKDEYNITDDNTTAPTPSPTDGTDEGNTSEANTTTPTPTPTDDGSGGTGDDGNTTESNTTETNATSDGSIFGDAVSSAFNDITNELPTDVLKSKITECPPCIVKESFTYMGINFDMEMDDPTVYFEAWKYVIYTFFVLAAVIAVFKFN
ncbi:MAG: hypothetical protein U9N49_08200, partial [Campylobacterota bacterium]|nr:hypothetical protein [Campylobacterota bacterium]